MWQQQRMVNSTTNMEAVSYTTVVTFFVLE